jgi:hypothetical protein
MKTFLFSVGLQPVPVTVTTPCTHVEIVEDPSVSGWPTVDYQVIGTVPGSQAIQKKGGVRFVFQRRIPWSAGDIIGFVQIVDPAQAGIITQLIYFLTFRFLQSGSKTTTFQQVEQTV